MSLKRSVTSPHGCSTTDQTIALSSSKSQTSRPSPVCGSVIRGGGPEARLKALAEQVQCDDDEEDRDAGRVDLPPVAVEGVVDAVGKHRSPVGLRRRHAEAEEAESREDKNGVRNLGDR